MPKVKFRNVYNDTSFHLITIKNGDFDIKTFRRVGQKGNGIDFINATKNVSKEKYILIGPHLDTDCDIEPTIITDIDEQRRRVLEHLVNNFSTFKPESVDL